MTVICVRWQSRNGASSVPAHGFDFDEETGINTVYDPTTRYPMNEKSRNWFDYTVALSEERLGCIRVWVDEEIVWDYEHDWYYSMSDLQARVWRTDGGSPSQTENV